MPHKKNPDVLELIRAYYHKVISLEFQIISIISNLPSGYNRDIQITKEPVIKGFEVTKDSLKVMKIVLEQLKVDEKNCNKAMTEELYATNKVYNLTNQGIPFKDAYQKIAKNFE